MSRSELYILHSGTGARSEYIDNGSTMKPYGEQNLPGFSGFTSQVVPT